MHTVFLLWLRLESGPGSTSSTILNNSHPYKTVPIHTQMTMFLFGSKENLRSKNRPCIIHPKENFGEPFVPQFSLPVILFVKYYGGLFCVVDLQKEQSPKSHAEHSNGGVGENGSSAPSSSSPSPAQGEVAGGRDVKDVSHTGSAGDKNKPDPTRSTPLHARLQAVEDLKCAAEYLLGVGGGGGGGGGGGSNEEGDGIADANGVGEGEGGVHAVHGE